MRLASLLSLLILTSALASETLVPSNPLGAKKRLESEFKSRCLAKLLDAIASFQVATVKEIVAEYPAFTEKYEGRITKGFGEFCRNSRFNSEDNQLVLFDALKSCLISPPDSSALITAIEYKHIWKVDFAGFLLKSEHLNMDQRNGWYRDTPLMNACAHGDVPLVRAILARIPDRNAKDWNGENALHYALYNDNFDTAREVAELLLAGEKMELGGEDVPYILSIKLGSLAELIRKAGGIAVIDYSILLVEIWYRFVACCFAVLVFKLIAPVWFPATICKC